MDCEHVKRLTELIVISFFLILLAGCDSQKLHDKENSEAYDIQFEKEFYNKVKEFKYNKEQIFSELQVQYLQTKLSIIRSEMERIEKLKDALYRLDKLKRECDAKGRTNCMVDDKSIDADNSRIDEITKEMDVYKRKLNSFKRIAKRYGISLHSLENEAGWIW